MAAKDWMLAADLDRERTTEILRDAYAAGRLDHAELDERTGAALRAQTWGELRRLVADIPASPDRGLSVHKYRQPETPPRRWPPLARRATSLSVLMLVAALACVVIGAVARSTGMIVLAVVVGYVAATRRY
jgi:hypothetical protein